MFKKIGLFILMAIMVLSVEACNKGESASEDKKEDKIAIERQKEKDEGAEAEEEQLHTNNYSKSEVTEDVKVVVDGKEITPTDNSGAPVETIIHNGVVYLPVRTVADATGKAYYWDGPNYTVYLGDMGGGLEYPTVELEDMTTVSEKIVATDSLTDNYGNRYSRAIWNDHYGDKLEFLLNMKYSKFKGTLYIPEGVTREDTCYLQVIADGKTIYTSPEMTRASAPIDLDINLTGYNDVKFEFSTQSSYLPVCLGDAGFYQ